MPALLRLADGLLEHTGGKTAGATWAAGNEAN
jgi:hypothetical protein